MMVAAGICRRANTRGTGVWVPAFAGTTHRGERPYDYTCSPGCSLPFPSQPFVNGGGIWLTRSVPKIFGTRLEPGHVSHRFQQAAISYLRRQSAYAPHFADAVAFVRRARGL